MTSLQLGFCELRLIPVSRRLPPVGAPARIRCGLRGGTRKPPWRQRVMSTEAIQAVQALKLAKERDRMDDVFHARIPRLLKADLIAVLAELRRQNQWEIALQVFAFIQKEVWYKPDISLHSDMIFLLGKNKRTEIAEQVFSEIENAGLEPDTRAYTEMMGAFLQVGMVEKAMDIYKLMKESGCSPDELTLTILLRNLDKAGEEDLASSVRKDCKEYMDFPRKFLKEVNKKYINVHRCGPPREDKGISGCTSFLG